MMSSSKKRKNSNGARTDDDAHPEESSLRQTIYIVQSSQQHDAYSGEQLKTHAVFSTINTANEAARRIFNELGPDYGAVTADDLASANVSWLQTGQRIWPVTHDTPDNSNDNNDDDDDNDDNNYPKEIKFQKSGTISIELGDNVGDGEELRVWVATFGVDEDMPKQRKEKHEERAGLRDSVERRLQNIENPYTKNLKAMLAQVDSRSASAAAAANAAISAWRVSKWRKEGPLQ